MLFADVKFYLAPSFSPQRADVLVSYLRANGAEKVPIEEATHVITDSARFEGRLKVNKDAVIVSDAWVERSMVLGKRQEPEYYSPDPKMIFSGAIVSTADLDANDNEVICAGVEALGGQFRVGLTRDCTHLLAPCAGSAKYNAAMHHRHDTKIHVLLPQWFDACFRTLTRLDEKPYAWPNPEVLNTSKGDGEGEAKKRVGLPVDRRMMFSSAIASDLPDGRVPFPMTGGANGLGSVNGSGSAAGAASSPTTVIDVWQGRKIFLSSDLKLSADRRETVESALTRAGAAIVPLGPLGFHASVVRAQKQTRARAEGVELKDEEDEPATEEEEREHQEREAEEEELVKQADILITAYRSGRAYVWALREGKTIGTLAWVFHVNKTATMKSPLDQILHFPIRRTPVDKFEDHIITITNYTGEARDYLKKLTTQMGAMFTPALTIKNTIVIAATFGGNKTDKAREWGIPVVNHLWIEDCFVQWKNLTPAVPRYVDFPAGAQFAKEVGGRGVEGLDDEVGILKEVERVEKEERRGMERRKKEREEKEKLRDGDRVEVKSRERELSRLPWGSYAEVVVPLIKDVTNESVAGAGPSTRPTAKSDIRKHGDEARSVLDRGDGRGRGRSQSRARKAIDIPRAPSQARSQAPSQSQSQSQPPRRGRPPKKKVLNLGSDDIDDDARSRSRSRPNDDNVRSRSQSQPRPRGRPRKRQLGEGEGGDEGHRGSQNVDLNLDTPASRTRSKSRGRGRLGSPEEATSGRVARSRGRSGRFSRGGGEEEEEEEEETVGAERPVARKKMTLTRQQSNASMSQASRNTTPISVSDDSDAGKARATRSKATASASRKAKERAEALAKEVSPMKTQDTASVSVSPAKAASVAGRMKGKGKSTSTATAVVTGASDGWQPLPDKPASYSEDDLSPPKAYKSSSSKVEASSAVKGKASVKVVAVASSSKVTASKNEIKHIDLSDSEDGNDGSVRPSEQILRVGPPRKANATPKKPVTPAKTLDVGKSLQTGKTLSKQSSFPGFSPRKIVTVDLTTSETVASMSKSVAIAKTVGKTKTTVVDASASGTLQRDTGQTRSMIAVAASTSAATASPKRGRPPTRDPEPTVVAQEEEEEEEDEGAQTPPVAAVSSSRAKENKRVAIPRTPAETPDSFDSQFPRSRRTAATRATQKLHDVVMPDVLSYAKQMKSGNIKGSWETKENTKLVATADSKGKGVMEGERGKKRKSNDDDDELRIIEHVVKNAKKRKVSDVVEAKNEKKGKAVAKRARSETESRTSRDDAVEEIDARHPKSMRTKLESSKPPQKEIHLMMTQVQLSEQCIKTLQKLGVTLASKPTACTHLIVDHIARTEKFLCAMSSAPFILRKEWATESASMKKLLPESDYLLVDEESEKKFGFKLVDAIRRAKNAERKILDGHTFYTTPKLQNGMNMELLKKVTMSAGGKLVIQTPSVRLLRGHDNRHVLSCVEDEDVWRQFSDEGYPVYQCELIFSGVLTQRMLWENVAFRVEGSSDSQGL